MSGLYYLYLKVAAVLLRALTKLEWKIAPRPDSVAFIPSREPGRNIRVHFYQSSLSNTREPSNLLINFHGSGFVLPLHGSDDEYCRKISRNTKYSVMDVQYRLAPENPFPAALHDAQDAVQWVLSHPDRFNLQTLSVCGFSAGGNLALVASSYLFPPHTFRSVITFYPSVEAFVDPATLVSPDAGGRPLPKYVVRLFKQCYLQSGEDAYDPRMSPALAEVRNFPRNVLIITAGYDTLAYEAERLADKLRQNPDRRVVSERMEKCDHAWDKLVKPGTREWDLKCRAYEMAVELLQD
ncbi:Alpha/Beta hydrolase protein [Aspergillus pseudodeflectus]|uniref:Alpha/Beta hydrolase protein n=1 Tax=Aspergillus pseudodeflectus TaxID=176178 RepID=A0ABR4JCA1_9EURO